jgi:hypothetical protein
MAVIARALIVNVVIFVSAFGEVVGRERQGREWYDREWLERAGKGRVG